MAARCVTPSRLTLLGPCACSKKEKIFETLQAFSPKPEKLSYVLQLALVGLWKLCWCSAAMLLGGAVSGKANQAQKVDQGVCRGETQITVMYQRGDEVLSADKCKNKQRGEGVKAEGT